MSIVFGNVVANAFARTEEGTVAIEWRDGGVYVKDSGPGIPGEDLTRVIERHVSDGSGGYGLGLSIAHTLCERLGWGLEFERVEDGTTVFISFDQTREPSK